MQEKEGEEARASETEVYEFSLSFVSFRFIYLPVSYAISTSRDNSRLYVCGSQKVGQQKRRSEIRGGKRRKLSIIRQHISISNYTAAEQ